MTSRSGAILKTPILRERWELNNDDVILLEKIGRVSIPTIAPDPVFYVTRCNGDICGRFIRTGKFRRRLQGAIEDMQDRGGRENLQSNTAGRTEAQVPARGQNTEAVRSSEHSEANRYMRSETADHDRDGTGAG